MDPRHRAPAVLAGVVALVAAVGPAPAHGEPTVTAAQIDALVVPPDQVAEGHLHPDRRPPMPPGQPDPCSELPETLFLPGSLATRTVRYTGPSNVSVTQSLAVYPSTASARSAFDALVGSARDCGRSPVILDPDRATWQTWSFSPVSGGEVPHTRDARIADNVVFLVKVWILEPDLATSVADTLEARIRAAAG